MVSTQVRGTTATTGIAEIVGLDAGNAYLKACLNGGEVWSLPSTIKVLSDLEEIEVPTDGQSVLIDYAGQRYLVGALADSFGGEPIYRIGKAEHLHVLFMASLALIDSRLPVIERLRVLVPDGRKAQLETQWNQAAERIKVISSCLVNGEVRQPQVREIEFVHEGVPAFRWAKDNGLFRPFENYGSAGVLDVGGGEATLQIFDMATGQVNWGKNLTLPGLQQLAAAICAHLKPRTNYTPDTAIVMRALATGRYQFGFKGQQINFTDIYQACLREWQKAILSRIAENNILDTDIGGVVIVGGGANHCQGIPKATSGRFFIPATHPEISLQGINAAMLARG